jgi:ArsR family transcriptional regulator
MATSQVSAADAARLAPMFRALGDPVRLQMVSMIAAKPELCVCEITPGFDLSSGTISHHLKTLREAGIVDCERRGTFVYYWVQPHALTALATLLSPS